MEKHPNKKNYSCWMMLTSLCPRSSFGEEVDEGPLERQEEKYVECYGVRKRKERTRRKEQDPL